MAPSSTRSSALTPGNLALLMAPAVVLLMAGGIADTAVSGSFLDAATSVILTLPPMLAAFGLTLRLQRRHAGGAFLGMLAGVMLKAVAVLVGGLALYTGTDWYAPRGVAFWFWLASAYLMFLAVEIVVATRLLRNPHSSPKG